MRLCSDYWRKYKVKRQPRNDLERIKQTLNATNPDAEWLVEQVPALIEEIEWLRWELSECLNTPDLLLEGFGVDNIEDLWQSEGGE
jgi:hypothetical protein